MALGTSAASIEYEDDQDVHYYGYGAISYSPTTRAHGWAYDYSSRGQAERKALAQCGRYGRDCLVVVAFHRSCGALAVGPDGYGSGWGGGRKLAEAYALRSCRRHSAGCEIIRWVCTTR